MTALAAVSGRILDTDNHEFVPAHMWAEQFGEASRFVADLFMNLHDPNGLETYAAPVYEDAGPVSRKLIEQGWETKRPLVGSFAPGAINMGRRLDVLDTYGVDQTFVFASGPGVLGATFIQVPPERVRWMMGEATMTQEQLLECGRAMLIGYNDWCIETATISPRLRPVAFIDTTDLELAVAEIGRVAANGIRAVSIPQGIPPGGISPGHPDADPLWDTIVRHDLPVLFHAGHDPGILASPAWADYGHNNGVGRALETPEGVLEPFTWSTMHLGAQAFISAMIFGGAFERFPTLRMGCIELSAHWVGPVAENMRNVGSQFRRLTSHLTLTPEEYFQRNVRVSGFLWEPLDVYVDQFPWLQDVLVYGSDYPHYEGGQDPSAQYAEKLARFGPEVIEKFFVTNAQLLMP
ncbi:amidohydrolase family protein [Mycobacterium sp. NPDC051804]|uniref:amidohydrolase family protein n=1 Tax=Mycobacterium sp. NPDC051804 TaxID=3364295 RepID=UPI0037BAF850